MKLALALSFLALPLNVLAAPLIELEAPIRLIVSDNNAKISSVLMLSKEEFNQNSTDLKNYALTYAMVTFKAPIIKVEGLKATKLSKKTLFNCNTMQSQTYDVKLFTADDKFIMEFNEDTIGTAKAGSSFEVEATFACKTRPIIKKDYV